VIALSGTGTAPVTYSVSLSWTPSSTSYEGFNVYRGSVSGGPYSKIDSSLISTPSYMDNNVTAGQTYYYVATEVDDTGTESAYSSEVSATIP
jgi:fibronectin type 3 domain-containing protein